MLIQEQNKYGFQYQCDIKFLNIQQYMQTFLTGDYLRFLCVKKTTILVFNIDC